MPMLPIMRGRNLDDLKNSTDAATKKPRNTSNKVALQAEINKYEAAETKAAAAVENHTTKANKAQVELNNLNGQLDSNKKYLNEAKNSTDGARSPLTNLARKPKKPLTSRRNLARNPPRRLTGLHPLLAAAGVVATLKEIADALIACVEASIDFESAMAGVAKTTNLSQDELARNGRIHQGINLDLFP